MKNFPLIKVNQVIPIFNHLKVLIISIIKHRNKSNILSK